MRRSGSTTRLAFLAVFTFLGCEQASTSQSLEEIRGSVTIERPCQYGTETELVAKKGDIVRLTFPENPSGRREFILLPKADTLEWRFPYKAYGIQECSTGGRRYEHSKDRFFGIRGASVLVNLKVLEGADDEVTITFLRG